MQKKIVIALIYVVLVIPFMVQAAIFERDLFLGMGNNKDVSKLQEFLRDLGLYTGPVTGNFFALTKEGVKKFQEREGIAPASGYFGPKTRARANELAKPLSQAEQIDFVKSRIKILQDRLKELNEKLAKEKENQPMQVVAEKDTTPPIFTKRPYISKQEFISTSMPLGVRYPYKIMFDWTVDDPNAEDTIICSPSLKSIKPDGKMTEYFPEPHTSYSCRISVKDLAKNETIGEINFISPSWISIDGFRKVSFPQTKTSPLKLGDISFYNGTSTDILFAQVGLVITDSMNSALNRNREVALLLRNGTSNFDEIISKTKFTFHSNPPKPDEPHKYLISISFPILFKAGDEKTFSLWIEELDYVISGALTFSLDKILATEKIDLTGGFTLQQGGAIIFSTPQNPISNSIYFVGGFDLGLDR